MEQPSLEEDRPYVRPEPPSFPWIEAIVAILLTAGAIYLFYHFQAAREPSPVRAVKKPPATVPQAEAPPAVRNPLPGPYGEANLPTLANSDSMMREALAALIGRKAFDDFVVPDRLIPRIVATIDNLPHRTAPRRLMPLNPVSGPLLTDGATEITLDSQNYRRYAPHLRVMDAVPASALVKIYIDTYPLFQRAYEELGYKEMYFNDRLIVAIDDLLDAPEIRDPVKLVRPKVFYEFADRDLETRSAGQKILIRMGPENAQRVKAKLREIREALAQPPASTPERRAREK
jgi:DUF3014 family protein